MFFAPLVEIVITPVQNANRPAIEKTTRTAYDTAYSVRLYKERWRGSKVEVKEIPPTLNPMRELLVAPGSHNQFEGACAMERQRLEALFGKRFFGAVYPPGSGTFETEIEKVITKSNPWLERSKKEQEAAEAAATKQAAEALMDAAVARQASKTKPA